MSGRGNREGQDTAGEREQKALDQLLADESEAVRAERGLDRELSRAREGARGEDAGHVDASDEEHEADGPEKEEKAVPGVSHRRLVERFSPHAAAHVVVGVGGLDAARESFELGVHLRDAVAFFHSGHDGDSVVAAGSVARRLEREV